MNFHTVIEADGYYPSEEGLACNPGHARITITNPQGATVVVEVSQDDGETWSAWPYQAADGRWRPNQNIGYPSNQNEYERPYRVPTSGYRFRLNVTGFTHQFKLWMRHRT
jgi:hypothetical protein